MTEVASGNVLVSVNSFDEWRKVARKLLNESLPPHHVQWRSIEAVTDLFEADYRVSDAENIYDGSAPAGRISRTVLQMLERAACYRVDDRWSFLYGILWRWHNGDRTVISVADADGQRLHGMIKTVEREAHKMNAFLRFRERASELGAPRFVAWFEPAHDVLPRVAQHFARRMGSASWLIATPQSTWVWDGATLLQGPCSANGPLDIDDEGERLWLSYYRSIFNPARLNTSAMEMHMPVRYWKNLPEGKLIPGLISHASAGAQRNGQAMEVATRHGARIQINAVDAQPERAQTSTLDQCRRCELWRDATQAVAGEGSRSAKVMLVGEQPGDQEDIAGKPFIGPAGQLLDRALKSAGLDRESVYVTNAVKHFKWEPRGKRRLHKTPAQSEIDACMLWLEHEVEQVQPAVIVALGGTALKALTRASKISLTKVIGQTLSVNGRHIIATFHPSYALRAPDEGLKKAAFDAMVDAFKQAKLYA